MKKTNKITSRDGKETITEKEFLRRFESGKDIMRFIDPSKGTRPGRDIQRVNVDFPKDFLADIDREADRIGVARQAWIKTALAGILKSDTRHKVAS